MSDSHSASQNVKKSPKGVQTGTSARARVSDPVELRQAIAVLAYQFAERRNFEPGHELEDWLNAESEILAEGESLKGFPA
ncbi:MAG TPA: DUF2934 domain-containing protein [Gemmatimonadaceae bacterium]